MSSFEENIINKSRRMARDIERLKVGERDNTTYLGGTAVAADSDKLDGQHGSYYSPTTHDHNAAYLGISAKAADSDLLDNHDTAYFATAGHAHDYSATYLGLAGTAADSDLLDGANASATPTASTIPVADANGKLAVGWMPNVDGWTPVSDTWTYATATTITVPSGAAGIYLVGDLLKLTQTTVKVFYIVSVADTQLTITGGSDFTLANAPISAISYSHQERAIGFPYQFNFVPSVSYLGGATDPTSNTVNAAIFSLINNKLSIYIISSLVRGSGDRTILVYSAPFAPAGQVPLFGVDTITGGANISPRSVYSYPNGNIYYEQTMTSDGYVIIGGEYRI